LLLKNEISLFKIIKIFSSAKQEKNITTPIKFSNDTNNFSKFYFSEMKMPKMANEIVL